MLRVKACIFGSASSGVLRGAATLALGSGVARVIEIIAIPVLTRLYSPEDFGVLAVFTALVAIVAPLVTLRYVLALPLPRDDGEATNLLALSAGLMLTLSALVALFLWLVGEALLGQFSLQVLAPWWWLIALGVLGTACYELLTLWATRQRAFKVIALTTVTQSAAGAVVKIALGLLGLKPLGLLAGQMVAQAGGIGRLLHAFVGEFRANRHHIHASHMRGAAWQHRGFPIWRVPSQFLMVFSMQAPMLFMAALYDAETTGQFGLAMMTLSVPLSTFGQAAGRALYGEASKIYLDDPRTVARMAREIQLRLLLIAIPPTVILFLAGREIFAFVFGPEWTAAGYFASLMALASMFQFTSAPLIQLLNLMTNQAVVLVMNVVRASGLLVIYAFASTEGIEVGELVLIYSIFTSFFYFSVSLYIVIGLSRGTTKGSGVAE